MLLNNRSQGIQFETLDTLCMYLNVSIEQLLVFIPYNFEFHAEHWNPTHKDDVNIKIIVTEQKKKHIATFESRVWISYSSINRDKVDDITVDIPLPEGFEDEEKSEEVFMIKLIRGLPAIFRLAFATPIIKEVADVLDLSLEDSCLESVTWFEYL